MLFDELTEIGDVVARGAAVNMAIDEVLLQGARGVVLRVYGWARPALSFGYFGKIAGLEAAWPERELVRRWTGGGEVPHGDDFTYTLAVPRAHPFFKMAARDSYLAIHEPVAAWLRMAGRSVQVAAAAAAKVSDSCFQNPVESDLMAAGQKIAGAAQRRTRWGLLHQGSIQMGSVSDEARQKFAGLLAERVVRRGLSADEIQAAERLAAEKYARSEWLRKF